MYSNGTAQFQLDLSDFICTLTKLKVSRLTLGHDAKVPKVSFDLGADIKEVETAKGRLRLKYTLFIDANPAVQRAELQGEVIITSPAISAVTDLQALGDEKVSELAMMIYAKNYETIYLTFDTLGLVAPSPLLIQDVHLEAGEIMEAAPAVEQLAPQAQQVAPLVH